MKGLISCRDRSRQKGGHGVPCPPFRSTYYSILFPGPLVYSHYLNQSHKQTPCAMKPRCGMTIR